MGKRKKSIKTTRPSRAEIANRAIIDVDYEKLADCVAKAIAKENDVRINTYSITREWMKFIIAPVFWAISILMAVLTVGFFITTISICFYCYRQYSAREAVCTRRLEEKVEQMEEGVPFGTPSFYDVAYTPLAP